MPNTREEKTFYLTGPKVRARYGVTDMTIHRWLRDDDLAFPKPFYIRRLRYWLLDELEAWEAEQAAKRNGRFCRADAERPDEAA